MTEEQILLGQLVFTLDQLGLGGVQSRVEILPLEHQLLWIPLHIVLSCRK